MKLLNTVIVVFCIALLGLMARPIQAQTWGTQSNGTWSFYPDGLGSYYAYGAFTVRSTAWYNDSGSDYYALSGTTTIDEVRARYIAHDGTLLHTATASVSGTTAYPDGLVSTTGSGNYTYDSNITWSGGAYCVCPSGYLTWGAWAEAQGTGYSFYYFVIDFHTTISITIEDTTQGVWGSSYGTGDGEGWTDGVIDG